MKSTTINRPHNKMQGEGKAAGSLAADSLVIIGRSVGGAACTEQMSADDPQLITN
jgi:hypothetical protein